MKRMKRIALFALLPALLIGASGGDIGDDETTSTTGAPTETEAPGTTAPPTTLPPTTTTVVTTTTIPETTTTQPPMRTDVMIGFGQAMPFNVWDPSGPSLFGPNDADPIDTLFALKPTDDGMLDVIVGASLPDPDDFDGDGSDEISFAGELYQPSADPRNGGFSTPDGFSDAFTPEPIGVMNIDPAAGFGYFITLMDPTEGGTIFLYVAQLGPEEELLLGDFALNLFPLDQMTLEDGFVLTGADGVGALFLDHAPNNPLFTMPIVGDFD